jgi:hypothetical protein
MKETTQMQILIFLGYYYLFFRVSIEFFFLHVEQVDSYELSFSQKNFLWISPSCKKKYVQRLRNKYFKMLIKRS